MDERLRGIARDLKVCLLFATCVPIAHDAPVDGAEIARGSWALPLIGALIGAVGAVVYAVAYRVGLPPLVGAGLALVTTVAITGCLHEDGLADTVDGLLGGSVRE